MDLYIAKNLVRKYCQSFDASQDDELVGILKSYTEENYFWRGVHPFYQQEGVRNVIENFWLPLRNSFTGLQRREDFFFGGISELGKGGEQHWVLSAGHFMGLFDKNWLGIPSTGKIAFLRYVEFHRLSPNGKIAETAFFCDIL